MEFTHGNFDSGLKIVGPCFFIGFDFTEVAVDYKSLASEPGQFSFNHQYGGLQCLHRQLYGALLPISSCSDPILRENLTSVASDYWGDPFRQHGPALDELNLLGSKLQKIGPLDSSYHFRDSDEAFLTFEFRAAFRWLVQNFKMIKAFEFGESQFEDEPLSVELDAIPTSDDQIFHSWLCHGDSASIQFKNRGLIGALIYENSD